MLTKCVSVMQKSEKKRKIGRNRETVFPLGRNVFLIIIYNTTLIHMPTTPLSYICLQHDRFRVNLNPKA